MIDAAFFEINLGGVTDLLDDLLKDHTLWTNSVSSRFGSKKVQHRKGRRSTAVGVGGWHELMQKAMVTYHLLVRHYCGCWDVKRGGGGESGQRMTERLKLTEETALPEEGAMGREARCRKEVAARLHLSGVTQFRVNTGGKGSSHTLQNGSGAVSRPQTTRDLKIEMTSFPMGCWKVKDTAMRWRSHWIRGCLCHQAVCRQTRQYIKAHSVTTHI